MRGIKEQVMANDEFKFPPSDIHFNVLPRDERAAWVTLFLKKVHQEENPDLSKCAYVGFKLKDGTYIEIRESGEDGWVAFISSETKQ